MFFNNRKTDRALDWLKRKNSSGDQFDPERIGGQDILAMILSALMIFGPLILILFGILWLTF